MGLYKLNYQRVVGPMPGACELCDNMQMEQDAECIVGYLGSVAARVICPTCANSIADARAKSTPAERAAKARDAKAAKRAAQTVAADQTYETTSETAVTDV